MNSLRNRRRLTIVVITFLLIFSTGAVFAIGTGVLHIGGTVILNPVDGEVVWGFIDDLTDSPDIISTVNDTMSLLWTGEPITWTVTFNQPGTATLNVGLFNTSPVFEADVNISYSTIGNINEMGISFGGNFNTPIAIARDTLSPQTLTITWDDTAMLSAFTPGEYLTFTIYFDWEITP